MKTLATFATALLSAVVLLNAAPAHAGPAYDQYRRAVLGDASVPAPATVASSRFALVPGSYAQYLIHNGSSTPDALAAAARIGESASYRQVALDAPELRQTPAQAYAKHLGYDVPTSVYGPSLGSAE